MPVRLTHARMALPNDWKPLTSGMARIGSTLRAQTLEPLRCLSCRAISASSRGTPLFSEAS